MRNLTKLSFLTIFLYLFISCSNDDIDVANINGTTTAETFRFVYKGINYSSPYHFDENSTIVLHDAEVYELYKKLKSLPELATYIKEDNSIEFFDNYAQAIEATENRLTLRREVPFQPFEYIIIELYDSKEYQGNSYIRDYDLSTLKFSHIVGGNLSWNNINFNKKASSFKIKTYERGYKAKGYEKNSTKDYHYYLSYKVIFYNDYELQNQTLIFSKYPSDLNENINIEDLNKYGWNNKIGTYAISLGYGGDSSVISGGRTSDSNTNTGGRGTSISGR